jgi:hypothetical protein
MEDFALLSSLSIGRWTAAALLVTLAAGCSAAGTPSLGAASGQPNTQRTVNANRTLANGLGTVSASGSRTNGWIAPDRKRKHKPFEFYWGNYDTSTITVLSSSGKTKGQITTGLFNPERLFVDAQGSVYATNIGYNGSSKFSITGYKKGQTTPFITITDGVNRPTGLTVDAAGTIYCANVGNNTITVYPKGKTTPSLTINFFAEYLATDANDNLYASGSTVDEFAPGSTSGKDLNLPGGNAIEVDHAGNIILVNGADIDYYPPGSTTPSKSVPVTGGSVFSLSLSGNNKTLYASVDTSAGPFAVESVAYPNGSTLTPKYTGTTGDWPIAASPDDVQGG